MLDELTMEWIVLGGLVLLGALYLSARRRGDRAASLSRSFGLDPDQWRLMGSDVGGDQSPVRLCAYGLRGTPDAAFAARHAGKIIIGEYKARRYRGGVRLREWYQILLYVGLARACWPDSSVEGRLLYRDRCISIEFDGEVFDELVRLKAELIEQRQRGWFSRCLGRAPKALHKRGRRIRPRTRPVTTQ